MHGLVVLDGIPTLIVRCVILGWRSADVYSSLGGSLNVSLKRVTRPSLDLPWEGETQSPIVQCRQTDDGIEIGEANTEKGCDRL